MDDIWQNIKTGKLVVADYKSQANNKELEPESYCQIRTKKDTKFSDGFLCLQHLQQMGFEANLFLSLQC